MEGVTEWKESVASVYIAREFARICFSLQWCSHTFLGEKLECASGGAPAQVPSSPPPEGLLGARAWDSALGTCSRVALGAGGSAGPLGPRHGGLAGQPCVGWLVPGLRTEPAAPARSSSEVKDPSVGTAGSKGAAEGHLFATCRGVQD